MYTVSQVQGSAKVLLSLSWGGQGLNARSSALFRTPYSLPHRLPALRAHARFPYRILSPPRKKDDQNASRRTVTDAQLRKMWLATGCSNPFSATAGEQPLWSTSNDGGAHDMFAYCSLTKVGTATPAQKAVCGTVPDQCHLQVKLCAELS